MKRSLIFAWGATFLTFFRGYGALAPFVCSEDIIEYLLLFLILFFIFMKLGKFLCWPSSKAIAYRPHRVSSKPEQYVKRKSFSKSVFQIDENLTRTVEYSRK